MVGITGFLIEIMLSSFYSKQAKFRLEYNNLYAMYSYTRLAKICVLMIVVACIVTSTLIFQLPQGIAHATGAAISIKPTLSAYANKPITVSGTAYLAHETVQVYWNYSGLGTGTLETSIVSSAKGAFTARFPIPLAAQGAYTIASVGVTSGFVAIATFLLKPSLAARGQVGVASSPLPIKGYAFSAGETVNIYWNFMGGHGNLLTAVMADGTGSFTTTITVPSSPSSGFSVLAATGQSSQLTATYPLTIYAQTLTLAPLSGAANSMLTMSAYGFAPNENVNFYWNNGTSPVLTSTTNSSGYVAPIAYTVPVGTVPGTYIVSAVGQTSQVTITNTYTVVAPTIRLTRTSSGVGAQVAVVGAGYTASELVDILWNYTGPGTGTIIATVSSGYSGDVHATFTVPMTMTGAYPVAAVGRTSQDVSQNTLTVNNELDLSAVTAPPGMNVTATGMGFAANEAVNIYWNSVTGPLLASVIADGNGIISQVVTVPPNATSGSNSVVSVGQSSQITFIAPLTVETDWSDFGFDYSNQRDNPFEQQVSTANVGNLVPKWIATVSKPLQSSPVALNGLIYITSTDGQISAYNETTGNLAWRYNSNSGFPNYSSALVDPVTNTVFFGTVADPIVGLPSPFYALDATTGTLKWSIILPEDGFGFPTLALNTIYVGTSVEGEPANLMAIDVESGHVNWQYATAAGVWGAVGADPTNNMVFTGIGNPTDAVVALNATTGAFIWQYNIPQLGPDNDVGSAITVDNGRVYTDSKNGYFYALNESDGSLAWSRLVGTPSGGNISSSALAHGVIYVGSRDKNLYALNESDGSILWKTATSADIFSSPAIANGVVYIASMDNKFYAMDATSGTVLWSFTTGNKSYSSPILINGYLYCASTDHKLYAFGL